MSSTVFDFFRSTRARVAITTPRLALGFVLAGAGLALLGTVAAFIGRASALPDEVRGTLVFVSDRSGIDSLYVRHLPDGRDERLLTLTTPAREPALSPDGKQVAFTVGGRIGVVSVAGGAVRFLTAGTEWKDEAPAWRPDGRALVVAARTAETEGRDLHEILLDADADAARHPLLETPHLDESQPVESPDGQYVAFIRDGHVYRLDRHDGHVKRLSAGMRQAWSPRFLASGRILFLWAQEKEYGIDVMDADGREPQTIQRGTTYYRSVAPSADGRFLVATFTYDLGFHFWQALQHSHPERLQLLDGKGTLVAEIASSWRYGNAGADWRR
jgi:Tol biopolymer transport system component